jgi:hypothetical protein
MEIKGYYDSRPRADYKCSPRLVSRTEIRHNFDDLVTYSIAEAPLPSIALHCPRNGSTAIDRCSPSDRKSVIGKNINRSILPLINIIADI